MEIIQKIIYCFRSWNYWMPEPRLAAGPAIRLLVPDWCDVLGGMRGLVPAGVLLQLLEL